MACSASTLGILNDSFTKCCQIFPLREAIHNMDLLGTYSGQPQETGSCLIPKQRADVSRTVRTVSLQDREQVVCSPLKKIRVSCWDSSPAAQSPTCAGGITWHSAEHPVGTRLREPARKMITLWIPVVLWEVNSSSNSGVFCLNQLPGNCCKSGYLVSLQIERCFRLSAALEAINPNWVFGTCSPS